MITQADQAPFFSIVIANYNSGKYLEEAILSILNQTCKDYELIIVDGGSSDNSLNIIKKYESSITWWISEKDNGQSDAFNKGFAHAKGQFFTWLNSDDIYFEKALEIAKKAIQNHPNCEWATGNFVRFRNSDRLIISAPWGPNFLPRFLQGNGKYNPIYGPSTFWSSKAYQEIGPLNENLHYIMDNEYWARLLKSGRRQIRIRTFVWAFRMHTQSKTAEYDDHKLPPNVKNKIEAEYRYIRDTYGFYPCKLYKLLSYIWRFVDLSVFVHIYNYLFVRNRKKIPLLKVK